VAICNNDLNTGLVFPTWDCRKMNNKQLFYMFYYNNCRDRRGRDRVVVRFRIVS